MLNSSNHHPAYHYLKYSGNLPYYSEIPKLKFLKKDDWRFSSDLYHRYCNLNSPLNKCYITSTPKPHFFQKSHCEQNEKLDYYYLRGYKKILNQELQKNYESFGFESQRERDETRREEESHYMDTEYLEKDLVMDQERRRFSFQRRHEVRNLINDSRLERRSRVLTEGSWVEDEGRMTNQRSHYNY